MNDEIISKSNVGSNIPLADEDAINVDGDACCLVTSWITSKGLTNAKEDTCSRNVQSFMTFRASGLSAIARRDLPMSDDGKMLNHRRESSQQRYARQSSASKTDQSEEIEGTSSHFENAVIKYQKSKLRPKRQISRERQQQQQSNYSSSDESVARNKSKSISSIDTQSVNNILDEYEDLDYRRSSDLSDVGNISVTNFEAIMMNQQKRQQVKSKQVKSSAKIQTKSIPTREKIQAVLKVNQQTQVRQRSRDRQKDFNKGHQQDICYVSPPVTMDTIESSRSKMPEILLRKGEVQKRVDEWLNQAHSQNFPATPREKPLTRSNSSAEKNQRRYRGQDSRSRTTTDEATDRLNGGTSSSYDDLTRVNRRLERVRPEKVNVGVNTSKGTYKEYLAVRSKQQDYGFSAQSNIASSKSGDSNPASRIPQRGLLGSSFKSRRVEANLEEKPTASSRIMNLTKAISESDHSRTTINSNSKIIEMSIGTTSMATATTTTSIISYRRPSLKRSGNGMDENCAAAAAAHSLAKEEMDPSCEPGPTKGLPLLGGSFSDQGEPISPNKDGESRRPAATASRLTPQPGAADKTVEATCRSTEVSARCAANYSRGSSRIASSAESDRVVIESPRRRLQFCSDVRREPRSIDQTRHEQPIYGSAVSARVRALQGQVESRTPRNRCQQVAGTSMETKRSLILPRKDLGVSSQDAGSQDQANMSISTSSSSFKPNNRVYTTINDSQQNEQNAGRSKIAVCENVPSIRIMRYASPDHVERIYERSLQPQVIHADDFESILRPSLQTSPYGEKVGVSKDRESTVKEMSLTLKDETFDKTGELRHEHLETIEEDDRKSENLVCRYPEIGLKQCLKMQKSLPNGKSKESDKRKENPIYVKRNPEQQVVFNESTRTFATFQSGSSCQDDVKSNIRSQSPEMKESRGQEEIRQDPDESTILQDLVGVYEDASREDQNQLTIHSRENSNLSTATIPVDELESQKDSRKAEEELSRNKLQFDEKLQECVEEMTKNNDERGAVVNEVLVKNLQFEQDLPENSVEQTKSDHMVQQVNFHNILCDDYENEKLKNKKMYMTKEEMEHQRLIDMLKKGNFETLKTVSDIIIFLY